MNEHNEPPAFFPPPLYPVEPRRVPTEAEQSHVMGFLAEIQGLCAKYGLTITSFDEEGIAITETPEPNSRALCWEIGTIAAGEVEGLRWV